MKNCDGRARAVMATGDGVWAAMRTAGGRNVSRGVRGSLDPAERPIRTYGMRKRSGQGPFERLRTKTVRGRCERAKSRFGKKLTCVYLTATNVYSTCLPGAVSHSQGCRTRAQPQALSSRPSMHGGDREFEMARAAPAWSPRGRIPAWPSLLQHTYLWSRLSSRSCRHGSPRPTPCIHAHCPRAPHLRACCGRVSTSCPSSSTDPSARDPLRARARRRGSTI
jgi:hypothetical protein